MGLIATAKEILFAQAFLKELGADWHNIGLAIAVVAWLHAESGGLKSVIGNNPFNLRPGQDIAKYMSGTRKGRIGIFAVFPTLAAGARAAAARLLNGAYMGDWRRYGEIVKAARAGKIADFLNAIALSAWDAGHYGLPKQNNLIKIYNSFTGAQLPQVAAKVAAIKRPKLPVIPKQLAPFIMQPEYLSGFTAQRFYRQRHHRSAIISGGGLSHER